VENEFDWSKYEDKPGDASFDWSKYEDKPKFDWSQYENPEPQGWGGIGEDAWSGAKAVGPALLNGLMSAAPELHGAFGQIINDPFRASRNVGQGLVNLLEGSFNLAPNIINYLGRKGIVDTDLLGTYKGIPHTNLHKIAGRDEESQHGDSLLASLMEYAGINKLAGKGIAPTSNVLRKAAQTAGTYGLHAAGQNRNPVTEVLIASGANLAGKALKKGWNLRTNKVAQEMGEIIPNEIKVKFKNIYNAMEEEVHNVGASDVPNVANIRLKDINKAALGSNSTKIRHIAKKYLKDPTYANAHKLQSDAGKIVNKLKDEAKYRGLLDYEKRSLDIAEGIKNKAIRNIEQSFKNNGNPHLVEKYRKIGADYSKAAQLIYDPHIVKYQQMVAKAKKTGQGDLSLAKRKLVEGLANSQDFQSSYGKKYNTPRLNQKYIRAIPNLFKKIGIEKK